MDFNSFKDQLCQKIILTVISLEEEWNEMSLPEYQREKRRIAAYDGLSDVCSTIIEREKIIKERMKTRIKENKAVMASLSEELGLLNDTPEDLPILELDGYLKEKLTELQNLKNKRLKDLVELIEKDEMLCHYLGETPYQISRDLIPSEESLNLLKEHISEMENEKLMRSETYIELRADILTFVEQLEKPLEGEILLDIVCDTHPESSLTKNFLLELRKLHSDLEFEVRELEAYSLELREKIESLWNLLKISQEKRDAFLSTAPLDTSSSLKKLENHLSELKELRLQNMEKFIEELKSELQLWWAKCFVGDNQKKEFKYLNSEEITEAALEAYESELSKWKQFYDKNVAIFQTVEHLLFLFDTMQQLEERLKDPSRLFNTRGGALLQEEKERKKVKQELPLAQDQLIRLCHKYAEDNSRPFLIDGENVENYISRIWEYHDIKREREKVERQTRVKPNTPKLSKVAALKSIPKIIVTQAGSRKRDREVSDDGKPSSKRMARTPVGACSGPHSPQKEFKTPVSTRSAKILSERNELTPHQPLTNHLNHDETLQAPFSYNNFKDDLQRRASNENLHSSTHCFVDISHKDKKEVNLKVFYNITDDLKRECHLKTTLNLASPTKKHRTCKKCSTSKNIQGENSKGRHLKRSVSQPCVSKIPSLPKTAEKPKRPWIP